MNAPEKTQELVFLSLDEIEFKVQKWLWDKLVPEGEVTVFHGHGGIGKSGLLASLVARMANGHDKFLGRSIPSDLRILWIDGEMGKFAFKRRMTWAFNALSDQKPDAEKQIIYTDLRPFTLRDNEAREQVRKKIQKSGVRLLIIDSYEAVFGNGMDPTQVGDAHRILAEMNVTTIIIDHEAKPQRDGGSGPKSAYGSVYKHNFARSALSLTAKKHEGKPAVVISQEKSNDGPKQSNILALSIWDVDEAEPEKGILDFKFLGGWAAQPSFKLSEEIDAEMLAKLVDKMTKPEWLDACSDLIGKTSFYQRSKRLENDNVVMKKNGKYFHVDSSDQQLAA